jgi:hypothetical protein
MRRHGIVMAVGLALAIGGCSAAAQSRANPQIAGIQCEAIPDLDRQVAELYTPGNVHRVEPTYRTQFVARAVQPRYVSGAKLYVPAQQGVSQGYLERVLSCHAASQAGSHPNDPLRVANVRDVDVEARGQRFVIQIEGADRRAGGEIYQRARALRDPSTEVEVRQLSSAPNVGANL